MNAPIPKTRVNISGMLMPRILTISASRVPARMITPMFVLLIKSQTPIRITIVIPTKKTSLYMGNWKLPIESEPLR